MIRFEDVSVRAGAFALSEVSFQVPAGAYAVLMGRTGSGKTTLIEILCGLRKASAGRVWVGGRDVTALPPARRGIGYVPQDGALFPTYRVRDQLGFALKVRGRPRDEIASAVERMAAALEITHLLDRLPTGLSGGERQRVALGRALVAEPAVLLLDEPLSALDEELRHSLAELLKKVQRERGLTALHITHSHAEAEQLADVVLRIEGGRVVRAES